MTMLAGGVFRGDQTQITHELTGMTKAGQIAQFGHDAYRVNHLDSAARL